MKEREGSGPVYSWTLDQHETEANGFLMQTEEGMVAGGQYSLPLDRWTHVAMTDDGAHDRLYVDGKLVDTAPAIPFDGHGEIKIGGNGIWEQWFDGRIDEVRIYDRALGASEVAYGMEAPIQTPKRTPVAAYSFDEGEGSVLHDVTGDGHDGTVEGAEWAPGRYGKSLEFHSSGNDVVKIPDLSELDFSEEFTLEAWVRPDSAEEEMRPVIAKGAGGGEPSQEPAYGLYAAGAEYDHPMVAVRPAVGPKAYVQAGQALPAHAWSHIAMVYDGSEIHVYVDGEEVDATPSEYPVITNGDLEIGGAAGPCQYFDGRIDEVRIYDRGLDSAEVAADMEAPIQTPKQGPVAAYSFDEGTGGTVEDLTGDGHTATIEGAEWTRGKYGGGMKFDGEDDVVKVSSSPEFELTEGFTLEAWVRPESETNEWAPILAKEMGGGKAAHELAWWLYEGGWDSNVPFGGTEPTPGDRDEAHAGAPLPVDIWSHVGLTYDGAQVRLYIDGELVDCSPVPAAAPPVTEGELQIGAATELGNHFIGRIDEVRVFARALNGTEAADIYPPRMSTPMGLAPVGNFETGEGLGLVFTPAQDLHPHNGDPIQFRYRYKVNSGAFGPWNTTGVAYLPVTDASPGDTVTLQVRAIDSVFNTSEIAIEAVTIPSKAVESSSSGLSVVVRGYPALPPGEEPQNDTTYANASGAPPTVRKDLAEDLTHGDCAAVFFEPDTRTVGKIAYEVGHMWWKCKADVNIIAAKFELFLRVKQKLPNGTYLDRIEDAQRVTPLKPIAGVIYGPYNVAKVCASSKPTEWLDELQAGWTITKGDAAGIELGGVAEEGPVLDSCGI